MGDAIDLNLFPSCYNCLSWSDDGELAVADGDSVHLQLPQWKPKYVHPLFEKEKSMPWTSAKVRTNIFTNQEWKVVWPSGRDEFSIGAEQSLSTVTALAWSHQGLGLHRRCVLAVLTSNLLLSLYEADGHRRAWSRVCIINDALEKYFRTVSKHKSKTTIRKVRIRAFDWCPPLKNDSQSVEDDRADVRWGEQLLTITTDDNDVVLVRVKRNNPLTAYAGLYSVDVLTHITMNNIKRKYSMVPTGSLWADALESKARILHVSCGPWNRGVNDKHSQETSDNRGPAAKFGALIALIFGSTLHLLHVRASLSSTDNTTTSVTGQLIQNEHLLSSKNLEGINFTGPLQWITIDETRLLLVTGYLGGRATVRFEKNVLADLTNDIKVEESNIIFQQRSFEEKGYTNLGTVYSQHNEPITGIVAPRSLIDSHDTRTVYLTALGVFSEAIPLSTAGTSLEESLSRQRPPWKDQMERYRQRYDVQYELGDMSLVRTWGITTFDGWIALAFTMHPGDVLEYTTRADESTTILFIPPEPEAVFPKPADITDEVVAKKRDEIFLYILSSANRINQSDLRSARLVYAACIFAINMHHNEQQEPDNENNILILARQALTQLSSVFHLPITEELPYCDPDTPNAGEKLGAVPKPASMLEGPGGWIFEKCHTCFRRGKGNVGLSWRDQHTTICENGHTWNRCALTFLAIQEPYITMFCSVCDMNVLSRDQGINYTLEGINAPSAMVSSQDGQQQQQTDNAEHDMENVLENDTRDSRNDSPRRELYDMLYDRYDTCAYCGGKYQDE